MRHMTRPLALGLAAAVLTGACVSVEQSVRSDVAGDTLRRADAAGFTTHIVRTARFDLLVKTRLRRPGGALVAYIEGDGVAWLTRERRSDDPTPRNPIALELAMLDPRENLAYVARPCQYVMAMGSGRNCDPGYWTSHRFSADVVAALDEAVSRLVEWNSAPSVELVGFSGGGGLAALIAAGRPDVSLLRTVAGNLDHRALNEHHGVTPLSGSANPLDSAARLRALCQFHYVGSEDRVVPGFIAERFLEAQGGAPQARSVLVEGADHWSGWRAAWPGLIARDQDCGLR